MALEESRVWRLEENLFTVTTLDVWEGLAGSFLLGGPDHSQ